MSFESMLHVLHGNKVIFIVIHCHYHHYADVTEGTEILKCLPGTFSRMCVSNCKFRAINGAVFTQLTYST